jgi:toxin secretion/phage lysis holin
MNTKEIAVKGIVGVITGVLMYASGWVSNIWWTLIILMGLDYLTGVIGAAVNRSLSSEVGWKGIVRKAGILILTVVCMLVDYAIDNLSSGIGFSFPLQGMVTILVCCWLIGNELLSILENLGKMGVPIPSFLSKLFSSFQKQVDDMTPDVDNPSGTDV